MSTISYDTAAEEVIEAIKVRLSDGTEPKTDLENMVKRLYDIKNFVKYINTRNKLIEYIQSEYIL